MPRYSYEHVEPNSSCAHAPAFDWEQTSRDWPLKVCPWCGGEVTRLLSAALVKIKPFDSELRDKGFTKLVRVDDGLFENRTRRDGEAKYVDRRRPETFPVLEKTVKD